MSLVFSAKSEELGSLKPGVDGGDNYVVCQLCDSPKMTIQDSEIQLYCIWTKLGV